MSKSLERSKNPSKSIDSQLARAINQYLTQSGFKSTAAALRDECQERKIPIEKQLRKSSLRSSQADDYKKKLVHSFESGNKTAFFKIWEDFLDLTGPSRTSIETLEFKLHIYFATIPLRRHPPDRQEYKSTLAELKAYLEEGPGSKLAVNTDLVPYFALPYVSDLQKHPVFKELLQRSWVKAFQDQLVEEITKSFNLSSDSESDEEPKLVTWKRAYENLKYDQESSSLSEREALKDYRDLQEDYYKIIDIASELIDCLEQAYQGKSVSPDFFIDISTRLSESNMEAERRMQKSALAMSRRNHYPVHFGTNTRRNRSLNAREPHQATRRRPEQAAALKKSESSGNLIPADPKARPTPVHSQSPTKGSDAKPKLDKEPPPKDPPLIKPTIIDLNFTKISNQIIKNPSSRNTALFLQALRHQITKAPSLLIADATVQMFAVKDFLSLRNRKNSAVVTVITQAEANSETREELSRLLNAMASFKKGRNYLLTFGQGKELLYQMALAIRTKRLMGYAADHALAALQKMSIRSFVQKELILSGMLEWSLQFLESKPSQFSLEYGTALLMNLCLNTVAQSTILRFKDQLLILLTGFLSHSNSTVVSHILGTLYAIFGLAKIRSTAKEMNFELVLQDKMEKASNPELEAQFGVLLKVLRGELEVDKKRVPIEEEDQEDDYVEAEIDSTDTLVPNMTELFGETLLQKKFTAHPLPTPIEEDEPTAPPGTVPRRPPAMSTSTIASNRGLRNGVSRRRGIGPATSRGRRTNLGVGRPKDAPPSPPHVGERTSSVASHATFIAENDKRKPLLAQNGLKSALTSYKPAPPVPTSPKKSKTFKERSERESLSEDHPPPPPPSTRPPKHRPEPVPSREPPSKTRQGHHVRRKSESSVDESKLEPVPNSPVKATSTSLLNEILPADSAPVVGGIKTRIPDDANTHEYIAAFGARPKIARTPDHEEKKKKPTVFIY